MTKLEPVSLRSQLAAIFANHAKPYRYTYFPGYYWWDEVPTCIKHRTAGNTRGVYKVGRDPTSTRELCLTVSDGYWVRRMKERDE